jgi:hypothetical protein
MSDAGTRPQFLDDLGHELMRVAAQDRRRGASARSRTRTAVLAVVATLLLVTAAGAATGTLPLPGSGGPQFVARDATGSFAPSVIRELAVLARPRTAEDSMGSAAAFVTGAGSPAPGSSLRVVPGEPVVGEEHATAISLPVWLLPADGGTVSMQVLPEGADGPASAFAADAAMVESGRARMTVGDDLVGLAPNGVQTATATLSDGSQVHLRVHDNVYGAHLAGSVTGVSFDR